MSTPKLQAFYKSHKWETFIANLRSERTNADGFIICEKCGKPILKAYDCIGHHIKELTDSNVDDVTISLNPENIQLFTSNVITKCMSVSGITADKHKAFISFMAHRAVVNVHGYMITQM